MTRKEYFTQKWNDKHKDYATKKVDYVYNPSIIRMDPFMIADGLWHVGDKVVCVHLIDTGEGLILIDSGLLGSEHILVDSIWRAGFDPKNIRMILHTHGHSDHYGASVEFKKMYGCTLAISRIDADLVRERERLGISPFHPMAMAPEFDMELEDGDIIEMGWVKIRCMLTPGHTEGVLSLFFDVTYDGKTYRAGLFGGAGTEQMKLDYIARWNGSEDCTAHMLESIAKLRKEKVDIHLGNHPGNNNNFGKRQKQLEDGGNPFIDENSWSNFLDIVEKSTHKVIEENEEMNKEFDKLIGNE